MRNEILRLLRSSDPNDGAYLKQALKDAQACKESRKSKVGCGCFACTAEATLKGMCFEVHRIIQQPGRLWL